jgi:hypothetical protein
MGQGFGGMGEFLPGTPGAGVGILPISPVHMVAEAALKLGIAGRKSPQHLVEIGEGRGWHDKTIKGIPANQ